MDVRGPQPNVLFQTMSDAAPVPKRFATHGLDAPSPATASANTGATARTIAGAHTEVPGVTRGARLLDFAAFTVALPGHDPIFSAGLFLLPEKNSRSH